LSRKEAAAAAVAEDVVRDVKGVVYMAEGTG
jgi:hypothetical protein